ncbi:Casein kinase I [Strongyloides ratti]|uniref:Casein kinase I n=1 Tax=Strongyloides ratti TaxID=34506 RepID=A0A090MX69_STRRB|nr:Casein kinase I [Strongyloides ratti]CEF64914.1 Casein kinase I [Strongyloides ratti]
MKGLRVKSSCISDISWLQPNSLIDYKYHIHSLISTGGFGQVYWATNNYTGQFIAIKIERKDSKFQLLKNEAETLAKINRIYHKRHKINKKFDTIQLIDYFETKNFNFMVMPLYGPNFYEIRKGMINEKFSILTTLWIMKNMILCLEGLHNYGWIHRDVKPANFCIDLYNSNDDGKKKMYLVDFGLAKKYRKTDGSIIPKRDYANFRGTVRYASLNAHKRNDLGRIDDFWSIYFIAVENFIGNLPWRNIIDKEEVGYMKKECNLLELNYGNTGPPNSFKILFDHVKSTGFYNEPKYNELCDVIEQEMRDFGYYSHNKRLDWEEYEIVNSILSRKGISSV